MADELPRVVVLGGGNGTSRLLRSWLGLLEEERIASLHALVLNADDVGGGVAGAGAGVTGFYEEGC